MYIDCSILNFETLRGVNWYHKKKFSLNDTSQNGVHIVGVRLTALRAPMRQYIVDVMDLVLIPNYLSNPVIMAKGIVTIFTQCLAW